ncbi:hypothetical protein [Haloplasma contractile]|uniref:Uncharacterized protein n=1 Tax=Haloplasma contractile SSD-17B TaxID=1033810 RepID=U2EBB9_9MOLU|nr:hypothetical protein [Haloplasma contractile]ERJ12086.1 hypothetical protein HLPCO_002000 [Haloplasma contractile SSD-17B]
MDFIMENWVAILFGVILAVWVLKPSKTKGCCSDRGRLFRKR